MQTPSQRDQSGGIQELTWRWLPDIFFAGCSYPLVKSWSWDLVTSPLSLSLGAWWSSDDSQWLKPSNVSNELQKLHHLNFQSCRGFNLLVFSSWKTTNNSNPHLNLGLPQKGSLSLSTTVAESSCYQTAPGNVPFGPPYSVFPVATT